MTCWQCGGDCGWASCVEDCCPYEGGASLADIFDNQVDPQWRADAFTLMRQTPHLVWLLLTKRPQNIARMAEAAGGMPDNAAIGCTVVTQAEAERDIPHLLAAPTRMFRFLSIEPMLGPIDLKGWIYAGWDGDRRKQIPAASVSWVICGGESGPNARPMHPDWVRSLRDQCDGAGVPFHFKQWGEWAPGHRAPACSPEEMFGTASGNFWRVDTARISCRSRQTPVRSNRTSSER